MADLLRWLRYLLAASDIAREVEQARLCGRLALSCAARSTESGDSWQVAARAHRTRRDAHMGAARQMAGKPVRFSLLSA